MSAIIRDNKLVGGHYVEPYAGGASLAISLLLTNCVREVHLNDLDRSIWAFWKSVLNHTDELIERIRETSVSIDQWNIEQAVQRQKQSASVLDLGFSTFFLNRTNRSGILTAGVIGGKEQLGNWKINARFNKPDLIQRIRRLSEYRSRIHVTRLDALTFVRRRSASLPPRQSLIYLDPPYYGKGQDLYLNAYEPGDHAAVAEVVTTSLQLPWIVSYDDALPIRDLYKDSPRIGYSLKYSASTTRRGKELIFIKPGLYIRPSLLSDI